MSRIRRIVFWLHLSCGLVAGIVIAIMSFTGVILAFESEIVAWAERGIRHAEHPDEPAPRLTLEQMMEAVTATDPEFHPTSITVMSDADAAVVISAGREATFYVNPYTGSSSEGSAPVLRSFMRSMLEWHRWLAMDGESRPTGRAVTGACNLIFLVLAASGLWFWWPRKWSLRTLRPSIWFMQNQRGKARDFNWHNVIGFWCAPVLIILTLSGVVMSYRWANDLLYRAAGSEPPARTGAGRSRGGLAAEVPPHPAGSPFLTLDDLLASAQKAVPDWDEVTLRSEALAQGSRMDSEPGDEELQPVAIVVRSAATRPRFASVTLALDPVTGHMLARKVFEDEDAGRRARMWMRYLHTGEAFGPVGQLVAGIASLGGAFLVYTGFALSWRRFFGRNRET